MPCYSPLKGYMSRQLNKNGNSYVVFDINHGWLDKPVNLPCGGCIGCRLERSRQWAIRCMHEADLHIDNSFITLTYDPEHLPFDGSLDKRHYQTFMKRLRKNTGAKIRYYHCGEYGEKNKRPHYHSILFGYDFKDKEPWKKINGQQLYTSEFLSRTWGKGFVTIGNVTFESAAYVARYIMKKVNNELAEKTLHYFDIDFDTGEAKPLLPEYTTMSRRPGIGHDWYQKFKTDVFPSDQVIVKGKAIKPPKYYLDIYQREEPGNHSNIKRKRLRHAQANADDQTAERLFVRETVKKASLAHLIRPYEESIT